MGENYWDLLHRARRLLAAGELAAAEQAFAAAREARERSPGRVFLSEKLGEAARRLWRRGRPAPAGGRWAAEQEAFRRDYAAAAAAFWDRLEGPPPDALAALPLDDLLQAVHLAGRSALAGAAPVPAADCILAALAACRREGRLPPDSLFAAPLTLTGDAALDVVAAAADLLLSRRDEAPEAVRATARRLLALLPDAAALTPVARPRRHHLAARLRDRLLDDPGAAADYRAFLAEAPPGARGTGEARRRLVDLLANLTAWHRPRPDYGTALALLPPADDDPVLAAGRRALDARREQAGAVRWASAWCDPEGGLTVVFWNGDRPADAARWEAGEWDAADPLLAACGPRLLGAGEGALPAGVTAAWPIVSVLRHDGGGEETAALAAALPGDDATVWRRCAPHPALRPPAAPPAVRRAVAVGSLWLATVTELLAADASLRDGIRRLAALGDPVAALVTAFLPPPLRPVTGWSLAPLAERPAPALFAEPESVPPDAAAVPPVTGDRVVVSGGDPAAVLAGWWREGERLRVVVDRPERLADLAAVCRRAGADWTLLPAEGGHDRDAALSRLEELAAAGDGDVLPLLLWCRLARTHNGDLLDALPPAAGAAETPWRRRLREEAATLPRSAGSAAWDRELAARAAASPLVIGGPADLQALAADGGEPRDDTDPDGPAAWAWHDAAALHWRLLLAGEDPGAWHRRLAGVAGRVCLLLPAEPAWGEAVVALLRRWLDDPAAPWHRLAGPAPLLSLAAEGADPDAWVAVREAALGPLLHLLGSDGGTTAVVVPRGGRLRAFWQAVFHGDLDGISSRRWLPADEVPGSEPACDRLVVLRLRSLDDGRDGPPLAPYPGDAEDRLALCGLELTARLAAPAAAVEVLDPRWRRRLPLPGTAGTPGDGEALAAACRRPVPLLLSPPPVPPPGRRRGVPAVAVADRWLQAQGLVQEDGLGLPPGVPVLPPGGAVDPAAPPRHRLVEGDPQGRWVALLRWLLSGREQGRGDAWLLLVGSAAGLPLADSVRGELADVVEDGPADWPAAGPPVLRADPAELDRPAVAAFLAAHPPAVAWLARLDILLPAAGGGEVGTAVLARLLALPGAAVQVHARRLPPRWRQHLESLLADRGGEPAERSIPVTTVPAARPLPVGRVPDPTVACPGCGATVALRDRDTVCPDCRLAPAAWLTAEVRRRLVPQLWRHRLRALRERVDLWTERPLCLWVDRLAAPDAVAALAAGETPWRPLREGGLSRADHGQWLLCVSGEVGEPPPECHHAVLTPAAGRAEVPDLLRHAPGEVSLWFHPLELVSGMPGETTLWPGAPPLVASDVAAALARQGGLAAPWRLAGRGTPALLETATGLPHRAVRDVRETLAWLRADLPGPTAVPPSPGPARLVLPVSRLEMEYKLSLLARLLPDLLRRLLHGVPEGVMAAADPEAWPVVMDDMELALADRALLALSDRLGPGGTPPADRPGLALRYLAPGGLFGSTSRMVARLGPVDAVAEASAALLDGLAARCLDLAAGAAGELLLEEALAAGVSVDDVAFLLLTGLARLEGGAVSAWPPLDPGPAPEPAPEAARRLDALAEGDRRERRRWHAALAEAWRSGFLEPARALAALAPDAAGDGGASRPARRRLPWPEGDAPRQLVVQGPDGSGRLARLLAAVRERIPPGPSRERLVVHAPDVAAAARVVLAWLREPDGGGLPRIAWPLPGAPEPRLPEGEGFPLPLAEEVAVLVAAERFPAQQRYRLARRHRDGVVAWHVDTVAAAASREHLFLDVPPQRCVVEERDQLAAARRPWEWIAELLEERGGLRLRGRARRGAKGRLRQLPAPNLDAVLAFLEEERRRDPAAGWEVVTPLPDDARYLRAVAARAGWIACRREAVEALLLPGNLLLLLAAADLQRDDGDGEHLPAGARLLPAEERGAYAAWLAAARDAAAGWRAADLAAALGRHPWSRHGWRDACGRAATVALVRELGDTPLAELWARPELRAWREVLARELGADPLAGTAAATAADPAPCLMTAAPAAGPAFRSPRVVLLGSGLEEARFWYAGWTHAADELLVCYTEEPPLPD